MTEETKTPEREKKPRGFAAMDPEKQREIARKGGKIAHLRGNAHEFTSEEAREAGRKGGQAVSRDRKHMARIGRLGGEARGQTRSSGSGLESPPTG
jgi:general stress protein YciG